MAIDRTAYNALVDDDGSNTVGSLWNKQAIKNVLLDPIDVALIQAGSVVQRLTAAGSYVDLGLTTPGADTWIIVAGGASTIHGIAGGVDGQCVTIHSVVAGPVNLVHVSGSCAPANRLINLVTAPTPLAIQGTATYRYDASSGAWRLIFHDQGQGLDVPYVQGNFISLGGGTWTVPAGSIVTNRYHLTGRMLHWTVYLQSSTIGGTPGQLGIYLPGGLSSLNSWAGCTRVGQVYDSTGMVEAIVGPPAPNAPYVVMQKNNNAGWTGSSPVVLFSINLEVQ